MLRGQSVSTGIVIPEELVLSFYFSGSRSGLVKILRGRAQIVYKLRRNPFACPLKSKIRSWSLP